MDDYHADLKGEIQTIQRVLSATTLEFADSYRAFFGIGLCFLLKYVALCFFYVYVPAAVRQQVTEQISPSFDALSGIYYLEMLFPLLLLGVLIWVKRQMNSVHVTANHLILIWMIGLLLLVETSFLLRGRTYYTQHLGDSLAQVSFSLNGLSIEFFTGNIAFVLLYGITGMLTRQKKWFWRLAFGNAVVYGLCCVFLPTRMLDVRSVSFGEVLWYALSKGLPALLIAINFSITGFGLKKLTKGSVSYAD